MVNGYKLVKIEDLRKAHRNMDYLKNIFFIYGDMSEGSTDNEIVMKPVEEIHNKLNDAAVFIANAHQAILDMDAENTTPDYTSDEIEEFCNNICKDWVFYPRETITGLLEYIDDLTEQYGELNKMASESGCDNSRYEETYLVLNILKNGVSKMLEDKVLL